MVGILTVACAVAPPPRIFSQVDAARSSPAVEEAKGLAPQVHARAEQLRKRAAQAHDDGKVGSAQVLAEHSLAAYEHAVVLSRLAKAESRLARSKLELKRVQAAHAEIDKKQMRVAAEAESLELRVRVAEDAIPLVPSAPASPEREQARLDAAKALSSQARLLCAATRLLGGAAKLPEAEKGLAALERKLSGSAKTAPIDDAIRSRSFCLRLLTEVRRAKKPGANARAADALLSALSNTKQLYPFRDDRGVVVTLRGLFAKNGNLSKIGAQVLETLGRVAKAHSSFPVMVVMHSAGRGKTSTEHGKKVAAALKAAGAPRLEVLSAGSRAPIADPKRADSRAQNRRVEIVFVAPRW